jgi:hypothetical protein
MENGTKGKRMTMLWNTQIKQMRGKERKEGQGKKRAAKRKGENEKRR